MHEHYKIGNYYKTPYGVLECIVITDSHVRFRTLRGDIFNMWKDSIEFYPPVCLIVGENIPKYETVNSAGVDLKANEDVVLYPFTPTLVHTGIKLAIPIGYEGQVRPRSGLALKQGITVLNSPGTIDADYRGEVGAILMLCNSQTGGYQIHKGDRIAQLVFSKVEQLDFSSVSFLPETERGEGGFGHTGK